MPKLRAFSSFKQFDRLPALFQRKILANVRLCSLELRIETGRNSRPRLEVHQRVRQVCQDVFQEDDQEVRVENEFHFILTCSHYSNIRRDWLENMVKPDNFYNLSQSNKLGVILNDAENCKSTVKFITTAYPLILVNTSTKLQCVISPLWLGW